MTRSQEIKIATVLSYFMIGFSMVCGLIYTPWMISIIGKDDYGIYVLVTTFLTYFTVDFGLFNAINKTISRCRAQNDVLKEQKVIGIATKIYLLMDGFTCFLLCIIFFFIDNIFSNLNPEELYKFKVVYFIASVFSVWSFPFNFLKGVYSAHELFVETKLFDFSLKLGTIVLTILFLLLGFGLYSLVFVYGFMPFITNVSKAYFLHKKGIRGNFIGWDKQIVNEIVGISAWLFLAVIAELCINNISPSILAANSTTAQVAIFGIALTLYGYVYSFSGVINGMFLPQVTELYVDGKTEVVHQLCYKVARILFFITGFITIGFISIGRDFIVAWVGKDFIDAYYVAMLLMVPQLFISTINIEYSHLLAADKIKNYSYIIILSAVITIPLSLLLSKIYGAIGVGISIFLSTFFILFIGMMLVYRRYLKFSIRRYCLEVSNILLALIVVLGLYYIVVKELHIEMESLWKTFALRGIVYVAIFITIIPFVMNNEEKQMISGFIKSKLIKKR